MRNFQAAFVLFILALSAGGQTISNSEESYINYFKEHKDSLNHIEGIWEVTTTQEYYHYDTLYNVMKFPKPDKVAIIKKDEKFKAFNMSGESFDVEFNKTDVKGVYLYSIYFPVINQYSKSHAIISKSGEMEYTYDFPDDYLQIKLGTSYDENTRVVNIVKWKKVFPLNSNRKE